MMKKILFLLLISGLSKYCFSQDNAFYNLYFEGNALLAKGQFELAIEKYNKAIKSFEAPYAYYNRGNAYYGKKDLAKALLDYSKTITLNPSYAEAYLQRGLIKTSTGDNTGCEDLKKAVKLDMPDAKETFKKLCK